MPIKPRTDSPAEVIQVNTGDQPFRQQTNQAKIDGADKGQPLQNLADMLGGGAARPDARNESAILAHVVRKLRRIENDSDVEEREQDDHQNVDQVVKRLAKADGPHEVVNKLILVIEQERNGRRKRQQRARENRRNHASGIDAERQVRRLPAHDTAADNALGILDRDAPLRSFNVHDEGHDGDHQDDQEDQGNGRERPPGPRAGLLVQVLHRARQAHHNAGEDDERHSIADTAFADLLAQPHDESGAGRQREDSHQDERVPGAIHKRLPAKALRLQGGGNRGRLNDAQHDGQVARVLRDFAAPELAFFLQALEVREHHGHQLQDDRGGDVRHDAERENRHAAEVAAAEEIEDAQHRAGRLVEQLIQHGGIDARDRNVRTNAVNCQQRQREQNAVPQVLNAEHVFHGFDESFHALILRIFFLRPQSGQPYATTSNVPPALVIFSLADALKAC